MCSATWFEHLTIFDNYKKIAQSIIAKTSHASY